MKTVLPVILVSGLDPDEIGTRSAHTGVAAKFRDGEPFGDSDEVIIMAADMGALKRCCAKYGLTLDTTRALPVAILMSPDVLIKQTDGLDDGL